MWNYILYMQFDAGRAVEQAKSWHDPITNSLTNQLKMTYQTMINGNVPLDSTTGSSQRFFPGGETKAAQILVEVRELQIVSGTISHLPSGKHTKNYGKSPFSMGKSTISMAMFNSYVKLPEGSSFIFPATFLMGISNCKLFDDQRENTALIGYDLTLSFLKNHVVNIQPV